MLVQFAVENVLSFREQAVLSLAPPAPGAQPLGIAAIYGPNASGKSNLLNAMAMAWRLVVKGTPAGERIQVSRFKLPQGTKGKAARFEFIICLGQDYYSYGFAVTRDEVVEEWLFQGTSAQQDEALFERTCGPNRKVLIEFGSRLRGAQKKNGFLDFVAEGTRPNQLFLREAEDRNVAGIEPVMSWFRNLLVLGTNVIKPGLPVDIESSAEFRDFVSALLGELDTGILRVDAKTSTNLPTDFPDAQRERLRSMTDRDLMTRDASVEVGEVFVGGTTPRHVRLVAQHQGFDEGATFSHDEESDGTRKLMHLAPILFGVRKDAGPQVFVVDELERSLHSLLVLDFIKRHKERGKEAGANQLIFTTHDTNLLDRGLLEPSEIWFVEKGEDGGSHLYSLAEFKAEELNQLTGKIEQGYLNGRFGAIPFLGSPQKLGWVAGGGK
jgi:AAA15 family ATPase/GTPase